MTTENLVATRTVAGKETIIFPEHDDDDGSSASDESSLFSRENIYNQKKKLQNAVKKITEKFSQEKSPRNSYEQLNSEEEGKMKIEASDGGVELNYPVTSEPEKANQTQWRSAIDAATGRTYWYVKGGSETFWEKPKDM